VTGNCCPVAPADPELLDRHARAAWFAHLDRCEACATSWDAEDPTRMFRVLQDEPLPTELLESVSDAVARAIDGDEIAERARHRRAWMATAAAAVLGAALGWTAFRAPETGPPGASRIVLAIDPEPIDVHAEVRLTSSSKGARIVDLTVGESQVVMIFDERMQL
jgi:hypothetical protein